MKGFPKNVYLLALIQAIAMTCGTMMVLVAGIFGAQAAENSDLATLPLALMILGTATSVMPITFAMHRFGRKTIFFACATTGIVSSLIAADAVNNLSFWQFCFAAGLLGVASAGFQQIRFAAIESAKPEQAANVLSLIIVGGLAAAIIGPELAVIGQKISDGTFAGAFYLLACSMSLCLILFVFYKPTPHHVANNSDNHGQEARPLWEIIRQPKLIVAVSMAGLGYALMAFIMTATPLHMHVQEHHSMVDTKLVIQSHILAMFAPSFVTGWLINKLSEYKVMLAGLFAFLVAIASAFLASGWWFYWVALVALGVGWNFLFTTGTSLLTQCYRESEKFKVQAINEGTVFGTQAIASLSAGLVLFSVGWQTMMLLSLPVIVYLLIVASWWQRSTKV
ncbi:MAG: MFS transporter [Alteromonadaceae bacterium]|nr:MFS transporter [Alteromonadaceae bacterium]